jgi:hypothetical protein
MDNTNREDGISYDPLFPGPPTLAECTLDFGHVKRGNKKTLRQIIANTTTQPMIWLGHTGEVKWLTLEPDHGILQPGERQSIRVTADTRVLAPGEHCVTLTFSSEGDETSMSKDTLSKVKVEEASMSQAPSSTPLPLQAGPHLGWLTPQSTSTIGLVINNPDTRPIEWDIQIGSDASQAGKRVSFDHLEQPTGNWESFSLGQQQGIILISPEGKGSLGPGESTTVYVTASANPAHLQSDYSYTTGLTLTSRIAGAANTPATSVQVPVTFYVSARPYDDGGPKIPTGLPPIPNTSFTIPKDQAEGKTSLSFTNNESNTVYWTLKPDPGIDWLEVSPSSGSFDPGGQASVDLSATRAKLQPGPHTTNLHLLMSYNANMDPVNEIAQSFPVTVTVE